MGIAKEEMVKTIPVVNGSTRAKRMMDSWSGVIQFELAGEPEPFHISVTNGQMGLEDGANKSPWMVIKGDADAFAKVANGSVDITHPIARGELRVTKGKVLDTIYLSRTIQAAFQRRIGSK